MKCKKCGTRFEPSKGLINYCSLACRNSRERSEEVKRKISNTAKNSEKVKNANRNRPKEICMAFSCFPVRANISLGEAPMFGKSISYIDCITAVCGIAAAVVVSDVVCRMAKKRKPKP